jgi:hypothetical protein
MKSNMRLIKSALEYRHLDEMKDIPKDLRGIYVLYRRRGNHYNVVYIGMSGKAGKGRIRYRLYMRWSNRPAQPS